jgi:hypothetical protein
MNKDMFKAIRAELKVAQYELEDIECVEELDRLKKILSSMQELQTINSKHVKDLSQLTKDLWENGYLFEQALVHLDNAHSAMKQLRG